MLSVNPGSWKSLDLRNRAQENVFKQQLPQFLSEALSTGNLAQVLNGNGGGALPGTAVNTKQATFTNVSTNQSLDCTGALHVAITMTFTAALTLTLTNLQIGASVMLDANNTSATNHLLSIAATAPGGTAYVVIKGNISGGVGKNFITGANFPATTEYIFNGQTTTGPNLVMVGN